MRRIPGIIVAVAAFAAANVLAEDIYKLIDRNGKVTYAEKPPKDFDGKVIKITVNPDANIATLPKPTAATEGAATETQNEKIIRRKPAESRDDRIRAARRKLDDAKKALEEARNNPGEGDFVPAGSTRRPGLGGTDPAKPMPKTGPGSQYPGATGDLGNLPRPITDPNRGKPRSGTRLVPSDTYAARLAELENAVKEAERELEQAERS